MIDWLMDWRLDWFVYWLIYWLIIDWSQEYYGIGDITEKEESMLELEESTTEMELSTGNKVDSVVARR